MCAPRAGFSLGGGQIGHLEGRACHLLCRITRATCMPANPLTAPARTGFMLGNAYNPDQNYQLYRESRGMMTRQEATAAPAAGQYELSHLRSLEAEAIHIIREVAAEFERP